MSRSYVATELWAVAWRLSLAALCAASLGIPFPIIMSNEWVGMVVLFAPCMIWFPFLDSGWVTAQFARHTTIVTVIIAVLGLAYTYVFKVPHGAGGVS